MMLAGPFHTLVVFIDVHHFGHEKVPHPIFITKISFSIAHELAAQSPDGVGMAHVLILHSECSFVSWEVWDVSQSFAFMRLIVMGHMLQVHVNVIEFSDGEGGGGGGWVGRWLCIHISLVMGGTLCCFSLVWA